MRKNIFPVVFYAILFTISVVILQKAYGGDSMPSQDENKKITVLNTEKNQMEEHVCVFQPKEVLRKKLTDGQFRITQEHGTEMPFSSKLVYNKETGVYKCVVCGNDLFMSDTKFDSGTGWPSFWKAVHPNNIKTKVDSSHGMTRVEVLCARCGAHLGHIFPDGPEPTGERYCINGDALQFQSKLKDK